MTETTQTEADKKAEPAVHQSRSLTNRITLDATPQQVWDAIATAEGLKRWFPTDARVTEPDAAGENGELWFSWGPAVMEGSARIIEWAPPTRMVTTWASMRDEFLIEAGEGESKGKTVLTITSHGFGIGDPWDDMYDSVRTGWVFELTGLKHALERHAGVDRVVVRSARRCEPDRDALAESVLNDGIAPGVDLRNAKAGDAVTLRLGDESLEAVVAVPNQPRDLALTIPALNDAYMRVLLEAPCGGTETPAMDATLWVSTFGLDDARRSTLAQALRDTLDRCLGDTGQPVEF